MRWEMWHGINREIKKIRTERSNWKLIPMSSECAVRQSETWLIASLALLIPQNTSLPDWFMSNFRYIETLTTNQFSHNFSSNTSIISVKQLCKIQNLINYLPNKFKFICQSFVIIDCNAIQCHLICNNNRKKPLIPDSFFTEENLTLEKILFFRQ